MGAQVVPPSVVFQRLPPVAPKYPTFGCPRTPVTVRERPPRSGPTLRQRYALRMAESTGGAMGAERTIPASAAAASPVDCVRWVGPVAAIPAKARERTTLARASGPDMTAVSWNGKRAD